MLYRVKYRSKYRDISQKYFLGLYSYLGKANLATTALLKLPHYNDHLFSDQFTIQVIPFST